MNNYYALKYITTEINKSLGECFFKKIITPYKNVLEFFVEHPSDNFRLLFSAHPNMVCFFSDYDRPPKKSNVLEFFDPVIGENITNLYTEKNDRFITILFKNKYRLMFRMFGHNANALLIKDNIVVDAFRNPEDEKGEKAPSPKQQELFGDVNDKQDAKKKLTSLNPMLPRNILDELTDIHHLDQMSDEALVEFAKALTRQLDESPCPRVLTDDRFTLVNEKFLPVEEKKRFDSVNDAVAYTFKNTSRDNRLESKRGQLLSGFKRAIKRTKNTIKNLKQADKGLERAERYERWGHLLMANAHRKTDEKHIEVKDLYDEDHVIKIPLKKTLSVAENAERYYEKSKGSRKSYKQARQRLPEIEKRLSVLEQLQQEVSDIGTYWQLQDWEKEHRDILTEFNVIQTDGSSDEATPFRKTAIEQYQVWIGRNAKSNDKLLQAAHKEDIWLHARGVPGSHVVIRMDNQKEDPPKRIVLRAASYAAYYSKSRGSKLAPVIVTKCKYVRKPKGGAAGLVKVDREEVEMVEPQKP